MAAALDDALVGLLSTCTALTSCTFSGHPSHELLQNMGKYCPLLATLSITGVGRDDLPYLRGMLQLQPSLLPNISSLSFLDMSGGFRLPDISGNHGIVFLDVHGCHFSTDAHWLLLPRNLEVLRCRIILSGPPSLADGTMSFQSLKRLEVHDCAPLIPLGAIAQLAANAPSLVSITAQMNCKDKGEFFVMVELTQSTASSTSAHLSLLQPMLTRHALDSATFLVDFSQSDAQDSLLSVISALPRITGVARCKIQVCNPGELGPLLVCFPDIQELQIQTAAGLDDVELQEIAVCTSLTTLNLHSCHNITIMGLLSLCHGLPGLRSVTCCGCVQLGEDLISVCVQLLRKRGLLAQVVEVPLDAA